MVSMIRVIAAFLLLSCGSDDIKSGYQSPNTLEKPYRVKGHWSAPLGKAATANASQDMLMFGETTHSESIATTVSSVVRMVVDSSDVTMPEQPRLEETSIGSLVVTQLIDNELSSCGESGQERCTEAILRIYTTGTAGEGLWNERESYGLPIKSSSEAIGLEVASATELFKRIIPANLRVLRLGNREIKIPLAIDYSDAGAGDFGTTIVLEYAAR